VKKIYDLIIIGSGPSGIYAGYLAQLHEIDTLILEASHQHGGQMRLFEDKPIYDLPGHINVNGLDILNALYEQFISNA